MYRELCRKFYQEHVTPYHAEWEKNGEISRECWREAGRQGALHPSIPPPPPLLLLNRLYL